ncbi:hypothetical protein B0T10DRAFT_95586 [Thelonectria olida]|uniref:Transcription factor PAP1 domain-containing protein n=1 Tax=Thelonectria olida TaxID=1576542 RepID=A0A9P8W0B9_9HYPO|nr:hypothetical protein B0T10DRAFT_95586 [Thelonectria olida]
MHAMPIMSFRECRRRRNTSDLKSRTCSLTYHRIEEIQEIGLLEEQGSQSQPESVTSIPPPFPRPRPPKPRDEDEDISQYSRVMVIDTRFQIQKASIRRAMVSLATVSVQDLEDPERLAAHLATVSGLPEEDCLMAVREIKAQTQKERHAMAGLRHGLVGSMFSSATNASPASMGFTNVSTNKLDSHTHGSNKDVNVSDIKQGSGIPYLPPGLRFSTFQNPESSLANIDLYSFDDWNNILGNDIWYLPPGPAFFQYPENSSMAMTTNCVENGELDLLEYMVNMDSSPLAGLDPSAPSSNMFAQEPPQERQSLTCNELWDKLQACPKAQTGDFDLDGLCSELAKKAECAGSGPVVNERDFDNILSKYMGKVPPASDVAKKLGVEIRSDADHNAAHGLSSI